MLFAFIIVLCAIIFDQIIKIWVVTHLTIGQSIVLVPGVANLLYVQNTGASWGILSGQRLLLLVVSSLASVYLFYLMKQAKHSRLLQIAYALLLGGALGNMLDRIRLGYVVDMIHLSFMEFPVFNVADSILTIGVVLLVVALFFEKGEQ